ncbi:MAG: tail fiber protein [Rhodospirillaceae bacterium]
MDYYMGMIGVFGFAWAPEYFNTCTGQSLQVNQNQALYSLIGTIYGGSGQVSFNLPNLQGRTVIGQGVLTDSTGMHQFQVGQFSGNTQNTLSIAQMPQHNHTASMAAGSVTVSASTQNGGKAVPAAGDYLAVGNTGGDPNDNYIAAGSAGTTVALGGVTATGNITVNPTGSSSPFSVMQPYMVMNPCMCITGLYPMRP